MNPVEQFIESLVAATVSREVKWSAGTANMRGILEEVYGNADELYTFFDEEAGAHVVVATYQYYEGEVEADEFIQDGVSILLMDADDFEIINEVTDEDVENTAVFTKLLAAIELVK